MTWQNAYSIIEPQIDVDGIHFWPFDELFPIDVRFFVFGRRGGIRMNRHDYFELLYVLDGEITFQIQTNYFTARVGDLLVIGRTFFHRPITSGPTACKAAVLYFRPELIRANDSAAEDIEYLLPFLAQDSEFPHLVRAKTGIPAHVFDLVRRIYAELPATSARSRLTVKTYLKMILILLVNHYGDYRLTLETFHRKQDNIERLKPLFEFMDEHFADVIAVKDAAAIVHMSLSHFMRFFKNVTGQAFVTYLHHLRVAKAQVLLVSTDLSIAEVGQEVGFCDQSYFGIIFRRLVDMTPRQYRKQCRGSAQPNMHEQTRVHIDQPPTIPVPVGSVAHLLPTGYAPGNACAIRAQAEFDARRQAAKGTASVYLARYAASHASWPPSTKSRTPLT